MQTLQIVRGDDVTLTVTLKNLDGDPLNLTDGIVFFTVKHKLSDDDAHALIKSETSSHTNAAAGITTITLTAAQTAITPGVYYYDLQVKDAELRIQSTLSGKIMVSQDVTLRTA